MKKSEVQSNITASGDSASPVETTAVRTEKPQSAKKWRYLNLWREDRTHDVPGLGLMDRDSYNSIMLGGDSSRFE